MAEEKEQERDRRLTQPLQMLGGALGGSAGAAAAGALAARYGEKPAARFGQRIGARFRMFAGNVPGASWAARGVVRHQSHLLSRLGRVAMRANIAGAAIGGGSALGDYLGDLAARRATGASGKNDEYRHVSALGTIASAGAGIAAHSAVRGARKLRWVSPWKRATGAVAAGTAGAMAGEASGNVHDARFGVGEALLGSDRRLTTLGKAWGPRLVGATVNRRTGASYGGSWEDPRRGYGTAMAPSWLAKPGRLMATDSATGGSTMATTDSAGFRQWKKKNDPNGWRAQLNSFVGRFSGGGGEIGRSLFSTLGDAGSGFSRYGGGTLERSWAAGALRKFAPPEPSGGRTLSQAELEQRRKAGKASAEKRKRGLGIPMPDRKRPGWYSQTRIAHDDPDFDGQGRDQDPTSAGGSIYRHIERKPQIPKGMDEKGYVELSRWAATTMKGQHERIAKDLTNKGLIPEGTDPKVVRAALDHTRNLAMHDLGAWNYRFRMTPEAIEQLSPLWRSGALWHARRAQANAVRQDPERAGAWAPFRREFGKPFRDGRVYSVDTRGHTKGEPKKAFYRHHTLVKGQGASAGYEPARSVAALAKVLRRPAAAAA